MLRFVRRILTAGALVAAGWTAAKAQTGFFQGRARGHAHLVVNVDG